MTVTKLMATARMNVKDTAFIMGKKLKRPEHLPFDKGSFPSESEIVAVGGIILVESPSYHLSSLKKD